MVFENIEKDFGKLRFPTATLKETYEHNKKCRGVCELCKEVYYYNYRLHVRSSKKHLIASQAVESKKKQQQQNRGMVGKK
jgi:hypothetical protein